jgi:hypothetical protein
MSRNWTYPLQGHEWRLPAREVIAALLEKGWLQYLEGAECGGV